MSDRKLVVVERVETPAKKTIPKRFIPSPPTLESVPRDPAYTPCSGSTFLDFPPMNVSEVVICNNFLYYDTENLNSWTVKGKVWKESLRRLDETSWLNDKLMDYCLSNINTLFGGDQSDYTSFIFPTKFLTRFLNIDHPTLEGTLDWECVSRMTKRLVKKRNLMKYDHIIMVANPGKIHWNCVVIYPKLKCIESIESAFTSSIRDLDAAWNWMVWYSQEYDLAFDPVGWNLYKSGKNLNHQTDTHNCGPFTILNTVCIHNHYSLSLVTTQLCRQLRMRLLFHLLQYQPGQKRLCNQWDDQFPFHLTMAAESGTKKSTKGTANQKSSVSSSEPLANPVCPVSQDLTQDAAGGDDDPPKRPSGQPEETVDDTPIQLEQLVENTEARMDDLPDILNDETFENLQDKLNEMGIEEDDPSSIMGVRMDELPSTHDDQTFAELQDELGNTSAGEDVLSKEN